MDRLGMASNKMTLNAENKGKKVDDKIFKRIFLTTYRSALSYWKFRD